MRRAETVSFCWVWDGVRLLDGVIGMLGLVVFGCLSLLSFVVGFAKSVLLVLAVLALRT